MHLVRVECTHSRAFRVGEFIYRRFRRVWIRATGTLFFSLFFSDDAFFLPNNAAGLFDELVVKTPAVPFPLLLLFTFTRKLLAAFPALYCIAFATRSDCFAFLFILSSCSDASNSSYDFSKESKIPLAEKLLVLVLELLFPPPTEPEPLPPPPVSTTDSNTTASTFKFPPSSIFSSFSSSFIDAVVEEMMLFLAQL
jgi:hypothetical protein